MARMHVERGKILDSPPEILVCVTLNPDIGDSILGNKWKIRKERQGVFVGKSRGFFARVELASSKTQGASGEFKFLVTGRKWGFQQQAVGTVRYSATKNNKTSLEGFLDVEAPRVGGFFLRLFEKSLQSIADELIGDLGRVCKLISKSPEDIKSSLTYEQMEVLEEYLPSKLKKALTIDSSVASNEPLRVGIRNTGLFDNFLHYLFEVELGPFSLSSKSLVDPKEKDTILNAVEKISNFVGLVRGYGTETPLPAPGKITQDIYEGMNETFKVLGEHLFFYFIPDAIRPHLFGLAPSVNVIFETTDPDIPWELIYFENDFMCLRHALGRKPILQGLPSIQKWKARSKKRTRQTKVLILANPTGNLSESEKEAEEIVERLKNFKTKIEIDFYRRSEVTKRRVVNCLHSGIYKVIHFAGHGDFNQDPRLSRLILSDGALLADEVLRVLEGTPLVFANACSSGRLSGKEKTGNMFFVDNIQGMASVFLTKGAQAYIGALWPVHDKHAASFSVEFYKGIFERKETVGEALLKARLQARRRKEHDFSWASFVLYGDPRKKLMP